MILVQPSYKILTNTSDPTAAMRHIEDAGRECYRSHSKMTDTSYYAFIRNLITRGHESVLEHSSLCVRFVCSRAVAQQMTRHRHHSPSMESQRFCNYGKGWQVTYIIPRWAKIAEGKNPHDLALDRREIILCSNLEAGEADYLELLAEGCKPEEAREVLPNATATRLVMTANFRAWRHFLKERTSRGADPACRQLTVPLLGDLKRLFPAVFEDITPAT